MNLIQLLTEQQAYEGITHSRRGASWNWRWRCVGDDEDWRPPSLEPQTESRSSLPRKTRAWPPSHETQYFFLPDFFSEKIGFCRGGFRVCGATRWGQPTWVRQERGAHPRGLCPPRCPSLAGLGSRNSVLLYKKSSQSFVPFWELLFLHKNNTMVVLLKTTSVRG